MVLGWDQYVSLLGAFLILLAYGVQSLKPGALSPVVYQLLNALGAGALCFTAVLHLQYGFIVLEGTWVIISIFALIRIALGKEPKGS